MEFMSALGSQEDAYRPSLFELVAQEKLRDLLQPAVQYVTAVSNPHSWFVELTTALICTL